MKLKPLLVIFLVFLSNLVTGKQSYKYIISKHYKVVRLTCNDVKAMITKIQPWVNDHLKDTSTNFDFTLHTGGFSTINFSDLKTINKLDTLISYSTLWLIY